MERVIEALSQMGPQEIREAEEMMKGGAGRGFYYAYDPVLRPPPPYHQLAALLTRPARAAESGSASAAFFYPVLGEAPRGVLSTQTQGLQV